MTTRTLGRHLLAVVLSSVTAVLVFILALWIAAVATGQAVVESGANIASHTSFFVILFGWPLALAVALAASIPASKLLSNEKVASRVVLYHGLSSLLGAITLGVVWTWFWNSFAGPAYWLAAGGVIGLSSGGIFRLTLMRKGPESR